MSGHSHTIATETLSAPAVPRDRAESFTHWRNRQQEAARSYLVARLSADAAKTRLSRSHRDPEESLRFLIDAFTRADREIDDERDVVLRLERATTALRDLVGIIEARDADASRLASALQHLPSLRLGPDGLIDVDVRDGVASEVVRRARRFLDHRAFVGPLVRGAILSRAAELADALDTFTLPDGGPDPTIRRRMTRSGGRGPAQERFASICLAHGLSAIDAAMIESLALMDRPRRRQQALWFDAPSKATRRWTITFGRIGERRHDVSGTELDWQYAAQPFVDAGLSVDLIHGGGSDREAAAMAGHGVETSKEEVPMTVITLPKPSHTSPLAASTIPLREEEDAASAMLAPAVQSRYRGGADWRRRIAAMADVRVRELREFVADPRLVPIDVRGRIVDACGIPECAAAMSADDSMQPFEIDEETRREFELPEGADWYVSPEWLLGQLQLDRGFLNDALDTGVTPIINGELGYAIPVSSLLRFDPGWAIDETDEEPDMRAVFAAAVRARRDSGLPLTLVQSIPRRSPIQVTDPALAQLVRRHQFELVARWDVYALNQAMLAHQRGGPEHPDEMPALRIQHDLRFVIIEDWQLPTSPSLADAPELRVVLAERGVKIISKAVFSDFTAPEESVAEILILDADGPATDAIRNALAMIRTHRREKTMSKTKSRMSRASGRARARRR